MALSATAAALLTLLVPIHCHARPARHSRWIESGMFEGDIVGVGAEDFNKQGVMTRSSVKSKHLLWPDGEVAYQISPTFKSHERRIILRAVEEIERGSCVRFVPRTDQVDHLLIVDEHGCFSMVGRVRGRQTLSLGAGCLFHEVIVHELLHALGFWHEQSRTDRDRYVRVLADNVMPGMLGQFRKIEPPYLDYLGESYDYKSIMHYDSKAFSANGLNTIEAIGNPSATKTIGKALTPSPKDLRKLNKLYHCSPVDEEVNVVPATTDVTTPPPRRPECRDRFDDCHLFARYCNRFAFNRVMAKHCPKTCDQCS